MFNVLFFKLLFFFSLNSADVIDCKLLNLSLITHCLPYIPANISLPSDYDPVQADQAAYTASQLGPSSQCPFFSNLKYQCNKYFIHCFNSSQPTTINATVEGMCNSVCWRSQSQCNGFDLQSECGNANFYDSPPLCYTIDYGETSANGTWQYVLGGCVGGVGLILACTLLYQWIKKLTWKPDPHAAIEFEDEKGKYEAEQRAGERYQGLEKARPFSNKDEFRTAQQARAEMLHRQSLPRGSQSRGTGAVSSGGSVDGDDRPGLPVETIPTEIDDASLHGESKGTDIELA